MNIYAERQGLPVYIHTQPWSWKAILLYISLGFKLQKTDTFSYYENEYEKAMILNYSRAYSPYPAILCQAKDSGTFSFSPNR
jgi:hypothetical protein